MRKDPRHWVGRHIDYLGDVRKKKIASLLGSNGRKAVPLAILGADVSVVDISVENRRYALELASSAGVHLDYIVQDLFDLDTTGLAGTFDIAYAEGGVLHFFSDLERFGKIVYDILKPGGKLVLSDSHPLRKVITVTDGIPKVSGDYFDASVKIGAVAGKDLFPIEEHGSFPTLRLRLWTLGEIVSGLCRSGLLISEFIEIPRKDLPTVPGEFVILASR